MWYLCSYGFLSEGNPQSVEHGVARTQVESAVIEGQGIIGQCGAARMARHKGNPENKNIKICIKIPSRSLADPRTTHV